ncbi:MAG TPA: HAMP domain-containing sensor histidine kinase [Thiobacillaceae bacterium]|nr:HAMP domain-containing sensor histidine kinase [Thiobacillaceae bacterium]HNU65108.1 HAMP domain-containing sensor histidine kinase [Thiobacillaceae bacterium]
MRFSHSLRSRAALAFAAMGGGVSLIIAVGLYIGVRDAGQRLIDETLNAEMQDYQSRRARNPHSPPPATATLMGYVAPAAAHDPEPPRALLERPAGRHSLRLDGMPYRLLVTDHRGLRYYLLHNETLFRERQSQLSAFLGACVALMMLLSGGIAFWLAERVIEPVKELARRLRHIGPGTPHAELAADFAPDEVGELARAFERSLHRLAAFIERERAFTADVSHELRTPLAVIRGAAEVLLADETRPEKERQRLARIEHAAADMADLIAALLAMARERGDGRCDPVDVAELLRDTLDKHRHLLRGKAVEVRLEIRARPAPATDPSLLAIVLANLVRNSFSYTERGQVSVCLGMDRLTIRDTGPGIPKADLERVFQRLYKGRHSRGTGIGLALVQKICERHGWRVRLDSEEGRGTEAVLYFATGPGA